MRRGSTQLMDRAKKRTREEQARLVLEMSKSGQTQKDWCVEHGIKYESFRNWVRRLKSRNDGSRYKATVAPVRWVEVERQEVEKGHALPPAIEIRIGKCVVCVPSGFDGTVLAETCDILTKLC
jgi:transposase-like protein